MLSIYTLLLALLATAVAVKGEDQCPIAQYIQFRQKEVIPEYPIVPDPYHNPSKEYLERVKENMSNKERVCALLYLSEDKKTYQLRNFETRKEAEEAGWIVTHQGVCGKCSTTRDLYVYLTTDLTQPVRQCGIKHFASHTRLRKCIKSLGFTDACTEVWLWNTLNTKKVCGPVCIVSTLLRRPYVIHDHLNKCLQCDQDKSGPIFKYQSGRTRRNSGIHSEIDRPSDQIYNVTHCYY